MAFLTTLFTNCHQANVHLAVFLNGSLEASRFKDWVKNQITIKSNVNQVLKHLTKRMTPPPKVFWVPPCSLRLILRLAIRSLNATVINRYVLFTIEFFLVNKIPWNQNKPHRLIRGVLIQSCPAGSINFTNYVFCHVQFSGVIQNIENRCAIRAKFWKNWFLLYKIGYFDNNRHRQTGSKWHNDFQYFG